MGRGFGGRGGVVTVDAEDLVFGDVVELAVVWGSFVVDYESPAALVAVVVSRGAHVVLHFFGEREVEDLLGEGEHEFVVDVVVGQVEEAVACCGGVDQGGLFWVVAREEVEIYCVDRRGG